MDKFKETSACELLRKDLQYIYRRINHALDNYSLDMNDEQRESLRKLYLAVEMTLIHMKKN